ncbi:hypothetical protein DER46DRAFT_51000 [Fusarium sp. MPI-SDFR-AT-0072]|nr:hypothetical protein DER46DRAFT_51000 [Fusarium sp. MPI-SDFR-AT-0072]
MFLAGYLYPLSACLLPSTFNLVLTMTLMHHNYLDHRTGGFHLCYNMQNNSTVMVPSIEKEELYTHVLTLFTAPSTVFVSMAIQRFY